MKRLVLLGLAFICLFRFAWAETELHWGPTLGFNIAQHYGTKGDDLDFEVQTGLRAGLAAGAFLDLQALPNLSLGYELLYSQKGSHETITIRRMELDGEMQDLAKPAVMKVDYLLDYLEVPVLLKVRVLDKKSFSAKAITGTAMAIKVKGKHKLNGKVYLPEGDGFEELLINEGSDLADLNMFDFSFVYGGALDFKTKLPLSLQYRFTLGWDYLALPTYQLFEPVELRNQTWTLFLQTQF
ncbi:hypothetical protein MASR1M36_19970 [Candidatus Cloacimonadaceae bacterium]